jgi:SAM-dependent methyltransferase
VTGPWGPAAALEEACGPALRPGGLDLTRRALDFCRFPRGARLLDAGCGPGTTLGLLAGLGFEAQGLDPSPDFVLRAAAVGPARLGSLLDLPQGDGSLDGLFCECVLGLIQERRRALSEIGRVLRPGGFLVLSDVFAGPAITGAPRDDRPGPCPAAMTVGEAISELALFGFRPELVEDHSQALRTMAARLVWTHGARWPWARQGRGPRPSYVLVVASKTGDPTVARD